jgi:hypothetical protein
MYPIPEHVIPLLDSTIYSAFAQLPQGYDMSSKRPGFNNIREQRQHAIKMLQMLRHLGTSKHTEAVLHWERLSNTLKMIDFIDE